MHFKKNIFNNNLFILMIFLFFVFMQKNHIFKKLYDLGSFTLSDRLINVYGYCGKSSYGFLNDVKKKYVSNKNPNIIDYQIRPSSSWTTFDTTKDTADKINIILNYEKKLSLDFRKENNLFINKKNIEHVSGVEAIYINVNQPIQINNLIQIYKVKTNKKILILEKMINETIKDQLVINLNYDTDLINDRWAKIFINIIDLEDKYFEKIDNVNLKLKNKYQINKKDIIFNKGNCYYIR